MKIKPVLPVFAFTFAISVSTAANFILPPLTTGWGKHTILGCIEGFVKDQQTQNLFCDINHFGTVCTVRVGTVHSGFQSREAYEVLQECMNESEVKLKLNDD
jgi:hypothetical protein